MQENRITWFLGYYEWPTFGRKLPSGTKVLENVKTNLHCSNSVKAMCGVYTNKRSKTKNKFVAVKHSHWVKWGSEITTQFMIS